MSAPHQAPAAFPPQQAAGPAPGAFPGAVPAAPVGTATHLGHALASEWTKIRTVRSTVWTLVLMFLLTVGVGLLFAVGLSSDDYVGMPLLAGGFFGLMLGQICVITLGVLVISSEYGTGMMRTTLTACPQRGRVLVAKATVFFLVAFSTTLVACTLTALIQSALLSEQEIPYYASQDPLLEGSIENGELVATGSHWMGATVGAALYVSVLGLLGLAVGGLLRHSAGAITTMLGVVLLPLLIALFMFGESLETLRERLIEYSPLNGLASLYRIPMQGEESATGWPLLAVLALITVGALFAAYTRLTATDA
ncbi:ABC transporter permease [Streptomyces sp. DSM 44917]|uniref:ABC transporter permease n=1 Tax=Streptomyces boetiae TaxID=3075541 RepID=A0ABU2LGE4_9ACTN|nr:ABC transporter permease [Streptomyces sp. DSM 44917]MDT0310656.1 ABC transporter permease [Streptomyces sp. DSM 44917]